MTGPTLAATQSLDDALLQAAVQNLSPEETSRRLGGVLSPARVLVKWREMFRTNDWFDDAMKKRALLLVLEKRVAELQKDRTLEGMKVQGVFVKELLAQMNNARDTLERDLTTYNANVGRQLGRVVDLTLTYMKGALREEVDAAKWDGLVEEALIMARHEIEKQQVEAVEQ